MFEPNRFIMDGDIAVVVGNQRNLLGNMTVNEKGLITLSFTDVDIARDLIEKALKQALVCVDFDYTVKVSSID